MKLKLYLFVRDMTYAEFGKIIGKSERQVANLVSRPCKRESTAVLVESATGGKVSRYEIYPGLRAIEKQRKDEK